MKKSSSLHEVNSNDEFLEPINPSAHSFNAANNTSCRDQCSNEKVGDVQQNRTGRASHDGSTKKEEVEKGKKKEGRNEKSGFEMKFRNEKK